MFSSTILSKIGEMAPSQLIRLILVAGVGFIE
jgi:hypothetical protein